MLKKKMFLCATLMLGISLVLNNVAFTMDTAADDSATSAVMDESVDQDDQEDTSLTGVIARIAKLKLDGRPDDLLIEIAKKMPSNTDTKTFFESIGINKDHRNRIVKLILMDEYCKSYDQPGYKQYSERELQKLQDHQLFSILLESPSLKERVKDCANIMISIIKSEKINENSSGSSSTSINKPTTKNLNDLSLKDLFKEFRRTKFFKTHTKAIHDYMISTLCNFSQSETLESIATNDLLTLFKDSRPLKILALETEEIAQNNKVSLGLRRNRSIQAFVWLFMIYCGYHFWHQNSIQTIDTNADYTSDGQRNDARVLSFLFWGFVAAFPSYWYLLFCEYVNKKYS